MIYSLTLETALYATGLLLILASVWAMVRPTQLQTQLRGLPRSAFAGLLLLLVAAIWAWLLIKTIDLGEFTWARKYVLIFIPIAALLTWKYVDEFLAARALGMVTLLAAEPLLEAAWMRPEIGRLLLVTFAYVGICFAMFWIGMPYTLRDQIAWLTKNEGRWKKAALVGLIYGLALVILPLTLRRSA